MGREARAGLILLAVLIAGVMPVAGSQIVEDTAVVIGTIGDGAIEIELSSGERVLLLDLDDTDLEIEVGSLLFLVEEPLDGGDPIALVWLEEGERGLLRARLLRAEPGVDSLLIDGLAPEAEAELDEQRGEAQPSLDTTVEAAQILPILRIPTLLPTFTTEPSLTPEATSVPGTLVPTLETTPIPATPVPTAVPACDPSYPDFCIPPPPPDLDCSNFTQKNFRVLPPDPHNLDGNNDGIGCIGPTATVQAIPSPTAGATATRTPSTVAPTTTPTRTPTRTATLVPTLSADAAAPCQIGQIKGNRNSKIYHVPTGSSYAQTKANVECFSTEALALAAGYRRAAN